MDRKKGTVMENRLTELEIRSMHQERTIQELFDSVYAQQQAIDRIGRELEEIREQMNLVLPSLVAEPEDEEPPPPYSCPPTPQSSFSRASRPHPER
jgi:uncharacterized coiled-coil protein SlyX